tara:strand:- start:814 stop:1914 length:1101 start_codon:yes stop_codon:yes gene_type:complete
MKKLTKITLALLASLAITSSALAGEFTVTGSAKATYTIVGSDSASGQVSKPQGIGISNEFSLGASGELDNGWSWTYAQDIDAATVQDDAAMSMTTPYGVFKACISECGLSANLAWDTSTYGAGSDYGFTGSSASTTAPGDDATTFTWGTSISSYNNIQYHTPADMLPFGLKVELAFAPEDDGTINSANSAATVDENANSVTQWRVSAAPIDGLSIKASYLDKDGDVNGTGAKTIQNYAAGGIGGTYTMGIASLGYGKFWVAPTLGTKTTGTAYVDHYENTAMSLGLAASDNLSLSYTVEESTEENRNNSAAGVTTRTTTDFEIRAIQLAYTMGGMTLSIAQKDLENTDYTADKDTKETIFAVSMAF